ncbi:MAG TPA: FkbM family methyltransferase [Candidatus Dormibacteraeota bacterium]|nr:FkbM family methyltransferase [Candidatus Dormibacteraeota bacterium]
MHSLAGWLADRLGALLGSFDLTLVDVGSMGGLEDQWAPLAGHVRMLGFEPDQREFEKLTATERRTYLPLVLLDRPVRTVLHVSRDPGKTSIYPPNLPLLAAFPNVERFEVVEVQTVPRSGVASLDDAARSASVSDVDVLKLDTQGSELRVLRGAAGALREALAVKVEVSFLEIYAGQPLFASIDSLMRRSGFELMDIDRVYWKRAIHTGYEGRGQLAFADALYFRSLDEVWRLLECHPDPVRKALKLVLVGVLFGFHDHALSVLEGCRARNPTQARLLSEVAGAITGYDESFGCWATGDRRLGGLANVT